MLYRQKLDPLEIFNAQKCKQKADSKIQYHDYDMVLKSK